MGLELFPECLSVCPKILASPEASAVSRSILSDGNRQPPPGDPIELSDEEAAIIEAAFGADPELATICDGVKLVRQFRAVGQPAPEHPECGR